MAEGIARSLAPADVRISSGGYQPTSLNPLAVRALADIGIDISHQRSKSVLDIPTGEVDEVITLCADEVCPVFLGTATRIHRPLPDPAAVGGGQEAQLSAFRDVRDERRRLVAVV